MSWMDSWSRPSKHAVIPPPLYLLPGGEATPYCHSCGRVIDSRKSQTSKSKTVVKYCSERCKHNKPGGIDRQIEDTFVALLNGNEPPQLSTSADPEAVPKPPKPPPKKKGKGDPRVTITCSTVEVLVFGSRHHPDKVFGRKKNRARRGVADEEEWKSVDMEPGAPSAEPDTGDTASEGSPRQSEELPRGSDGGDNGARPSALFGAGKVRPPQSEWDVNGSVGGEKGWAERTEESEETIAKRKEGDMWAHRREMVVEASFAKGEWGIRWRE
ncbi:hypothetical protein LPUS_10088 [Lasallia pustulata]|uniref:Uncharacterized protein n=1 Tax=Lasallia pustulata TaxID=136370 RepID=A0A1W5D8N3_9LECA|nr:hypothetical protein LPUS_10088 [Lasallia pustulata]